jgi:hypothetical protein
VPHLESRIVDALSGGPLACVALAAELARPFIAPPPKRAKPKRTRATLDAPAPLTTLFAALDTRRGVGSQDRLVAPSEWEIVDGKLRFAEENQCVCEWACDVAGDDPQVYYRHHRQSGWSDDHLALSQFLLRFATIETMFGASAGASAPCLADAKLPQVLVTMRHLPFADAHWSEAPARLYGRADALALVSPNGEGVFSIWVGAPDGEGLAFLAGAIDGDWDWRSP